MGKLRSHEIIEYRKIIESEICKSQALVKLLGCAGEKYPEVIIPYKYSFPYEYIPGTQEETKRFINYEISAEINPNNNVFKNFTINFFIVCHEDIIKYTENGRTYLWYDRAASELDNIFCGKNKLGIGNTLLTSNMPYAPQQKYKGRLLKFNVKDFNNGLKYGK